MFKINPIEGENFYISNYKDSINVRLFYKSNTYKLLI